MRISAIIVPLALLSMPLSAQDVYRSVDAEGNAVYSDRPGDDSAVRVAIAASAPPPAVTGAVAASEPAAEEPEGPDEDTIAAAEAAQLAEDRAANCEYARRRSETYAVSHRLYRVDENGERVYYSDAELTEARNQASAEVSQWCG